DPAAVRTIVDNAVAFSDDLGGLGREASQIIGIVRGAATDLQTFTAGINSSLADIDALIASIPAARIDAIVTNVDVIASGFAGRMPQIEAFIDSARGATASIDTIAA